MDHELSTLDVTWHANTCLTEKYLFHANIGVHRTALYFTWPDTDNMRQGAAEGCTTRELGLGHLRDKGFKVQHLLSFNILLHLRQIEHISSTCSLHRSIFSLLDNGLCGIRTRGCGR